MYIHINMHLPPILNPPILVKATHDLGQIQLVAQVPQTPQKPVDPYLYRLIMDNIDTKYDIVGGYGFIFYRVKQANQVKEYKVHGQRYIVDFSEL